MRLLLIGGGGREHALAWKLAQSPQVETIYAAPGNPGIALLDKCECIDLPLQELEKLADYAEANCIDLTVVVKTFLNALITSLVNVLAIMIFLSNSTLSPIFNLLINSVLL